MDSFWWKTKRLESHPSVPLNQQSLEILELSFLLNISPLNFCSHPKIFCQPAAFFPRYSSFHIVKGSAKTWTSTQASNHIDMGRDTNKETNSCTDRTQTRMIKDTDKEMDTDTNTDMEMDTYTSLLRERKIDLLHYCSSFHLIIVISLEKDKKDFFLARNACWLESNIDKGDFWLNLTVL